MKLSINRPQWATKTLASAFVLGLALSAHAQQGGNRPNFQNMTPEQRQQMMAQMEERRAQQRQDWLKEAMTAAGVTDAASQTAVIDYIKAEEKTTLSLQDQARALAALLIKPETTNEQYKTQLTAYRDAVAAAKKKQVTDLAALDTQVKYSTQARTETLLTLLGVLGDETTELGGIGAIFPDSPYGNRGGMGGRGGQGGQGRGGQGGGRRGGQGGGGAAAAPAQN